MLNLFFLVVSIWKLKAHEKVKFFIWLAAHNSTPTRELLHHMHAIHSSTCPCFLQGTETFLHCFRDYLLPRRLWDHMGFMDDVFLHESNSMNWIKTQACG